MADVTAQKMLKNLIKVRDLIPETIKNSIKSNEKELLALQRAQIYDGKNNKGEDLRPLYTEDNYFKTQAQAIGYSKWKQAITPNPKRNPNAPNLYINGYVHRNIFIVEESGNIIFDFNPRVDFGESIKAKYKDLLGLNPKNQLYINNERIIPELWELFQKYL